MEFGYFEIFIFILYNIMPRLKKIAKQITLKKKEIKKEYLEEKNKKDIFRLDIFALFYFINSVLLVNALNKSYTEIMITIEGCGEQQILQNTDTFGNVAPFDDIPDEIYINNILQNDRSFSVYIDCETEAELIM